MMGRQLSEAGMIERCPACGAMDCLCAYYGPDCPICLREEHDCTCDEDSVLEPTDDEETDDDDTY